MTDSVLVNGEPGDTVEIHDRGLQYGDGLFETIAIRNGSPCLWRRHMQRLEQGCGRLGISCPAERMWAADIERLADNRPDAIAKLILTRGAGQRGYAVSGTAAVNRIVMVSAAPTYPDQWLSDGIKAMWCSNRLGLNPGLAGIKHLNRLEQVMARSEWPAGQDSDGIAEGIMLDCNGNVIEGVSSNLFIVRNKQLFTPVIRECGVAGVMRAELCRMATDMGIDCRETVLKPDDIMQADEIFMSNSIIGIWVVRQLGDKSFPAGPVTLELRKQVKSISFA